MAELYDQNKIYANRPTASSQAPQSADAELEAMLAELPPEEREAARAKITAPPTGEDIYKVMQERNANGEVFNMNLDQYRQYKAYIKTKEVDVLDAMGTAAEGVFNEIMAAAGSIADKPLESTAKLTPSLVEAFAQGTRSLYGMAAQSQDPNSVFFRVKNAITANGDDEQAEFQQFMDAQAFNVHSMRLATGQDTILMDKDIINPEMTQVMSYIADPTLFVPFGGIAAKGARMIGMGEGLAKASARAAQIQRKVLGGAIKWGVGSPIEFLGTATRNTIDYGLERAGAAFEVATGMPMAEAQATAKMYGLQTASAALEGRTVGLPIVGDIAGAMVGSTTARGVGEALTMVGEQMQKQQQFGRGILSYAGQALRDANKSGVPLSKHAKALLNVLDKVDPLFVYSADISKGAAEGMAIGAGLGYLSAGEEGAASGAGAGMALGAAGAGMGAVVADVGKGRLYDRIAVQRQMVIEGLRQIDPEKAAAFEALVKTAEINGNRDVIAQIDGIITGIDVMAPDAKVVVRDADAHIEWLRSQKIDPNTGRLMEPLALFPEFGTDRKSRAKALSFLSMLGNRFDGDHKLLIKELQGLPQDHSLRKQFMRLSEEQKKSVFDAIDKAATPEFKEKFGGKNGYEFYGDLNYAEANVARVNAMFDAGNKTQANEMIRQFLKDETGKDGKLSSRGELLKQKLATEGYFDKDGNMRPSRLKDVEMTAKEFKNAKGFVFRRDSTGQVELHINIKEFGKETLPHELFHAVMLDSVLKPDFIDRLSQNLLGKFDADGKRIENASVDIKQVRQFFQRYIDALHGKNSPDANNQTARLEAAMKEYESRGTTNKIALDTKNTLEGLLEEFGAYYFGAFINDKPVDFLFRGGELGAMREIMGNAKQGFLDFWRSKIKGMNPDFNFDPATNQFIFQAFEKEGVRTKNKSLDLLMRDFVRATAMANKQGGFDVSRLSPAARETFIKNNGIRGLSMTRDANGNLVRSSQRKVIQEQMRTGKEIYKILSGLDPKFRQGLITDGEGNLSGRLSPEAMEAIVQSGHVDRAWVDKIQQGYNILDGKGGNVIYFGYLGRTAQIGDYAWPRLVGSDVPFKNRQAVLLGVDFKVGKDGKMYSLFHTLDKAVIDGRADVLWSDSAVRTLWNGDRGAMEADFFRYLANASKAAGDSSRVESSVLLEDGTGAGARRRDVLHQMLGIVKAEGDVYLNKPIAEIPYGIRHSVTTFNVDGIANMRVGTDRWNVVPENAFKDLSRNFQPSEMAREDTPNGAIIKHPLGYKFAEKNGKVRAFDDQGNTIGVFDGIQQAAEAAQKHSVKQKQELIKSANDYTTEQFNQGRKFQVLEKGERDEAVRLGDVFEVLKVKRFTEGTNVIRQSRDEYVLDRAERELVAGSTAFYERLIRNAGEEMVNALEAEERFTSAANALTEGISRLEQATAENNLRLKRGEITNEEYNSIGTAIFNDYKNLVKQKDSAGDAYNKYRGQNFTMLSVFLETGAEGDWKQQIRNGELPKLTDEGLEKLNQFARKHIEQYRTNAVQGLPETISALYSDEYNQQFKTGEAFTTVATHGTKSLDLMVAREFSRDKLGTSFKIFSSLNAVFSAGQESTGVRYAGTSSASGTPLHLVISKYSPEFLSAKQDLNVHVGYLLDSLIQSYFKDSLKPTYEQFKNRFNKFSTEESARKAYEMHGNEFVVHNGELVSRTRLSESLREVVGYKFESEEFKGLLDYVEDYYGVKLKEVIKNGDKVKEQEMMNFIRRLIIRNANDIGTPDNTVYNALHATDTVNLNHSGGVGAARLISDGYYMLENAMRTVGYSLSDIGIDTKSVQDASSTYYEGVRNSVDANLNRIIGETKRVPMEVRTLVKMNNPLVIEGRKEYGEYYLKDIMEPAMKAGHDGVVFRNMRDGGKYDNIYAVFKDYMDSNLMIIDTSFDDVKMPRGKDSEGNPVRYGRELGLRNQPTEGAEGGRVYDQNSNEFKFNFIGKQAEENQDLIQDKNIEFVKRKDGSYRITLTDNGEGYNTRKIGHITATIDDASVVAGEGAAEISSNIDPKYRGQKLANILYSEMAERLRSMGIKYVDGTIVNKDGIPVQVRNTVIGQTYYKGSNKPAFREDTAKKVQAVQSVYPSKGIGVYNELDPKARYQPTEGGRTYTPEQMSSKFIGRIAEENPSLTKGLKLYYGKVPQGMGAVGVTLRNNKGDVVANIKAMINKDSPNYANIEYSEVAEKQQGKGLGKLVYSELIERLRSLGIEEVSGTVIDSKGRPQAIRRTVIDDVNKGLYKEFSKEKRGWKTTEEESSDLSEGIDVISQLHRKARYQPAEYQGGDDYYKPKKNKFESKDEEGLLIRKASIKDDNLDAGIEHNPEALSWYDIGHYGQGGTDAENKLERKNSGLWYWKDNTGIKTKNPLMEMDRPDFTHNEWFDSSFKYQDDMPGIYGRYEKPQYDKKGNLIKRGRISLTNTYRSPITDMADAHFYKEAIANSLKHPVDDFDAYWFGATPSVKREMGLSPKDQLPVKFQPAELEVLNITRTQDIPWFRNLIAGGSYVRYAGIEELNYLRGLQAVSHGADTLTGVDVNTTQGRRIVEGKGGLGYALNPNNEAAWASIGKGFIELINQTVQANLDKEGINQKTALLPLVFTTYRKNLNSVQGSEAYYNIFEILRRGQILSDKDLRIAMSKAVEKLYVNKKGEAVQSQTYALRNIVKNSKMNWDEMLSGIFATLADSDVQNFGTRGRMADDFFGAVWKRLDLSESKKKQIRGLFPEWKTVSKGDSITVEDMKTNVADITTDTLSKGLKNGDVYAILKFNDFVTDTKSNHRSYDTGVVQKDGKKPEIIILKKPVSIDDFYQSSVTSKGEQDLSNITDRSVKTNLLGMNARPYGQARVKLAGSVDFRDVAAKMQPSEGFSNFQTERTPTGVLLKNAAGYVISRVGSKYRVYNPYKAVIGVFDSEEQAKKRIYKEEPRR